MSYQSRPLRILLLGDTSNYHNALAAGLRSMGHDVTVASDGTMWMDTHRDIDLSRGSGKVGGLKLWAEMRWLRRRLFVGYDIVSICGTHFAKLRPERLRSIFDYVCRHNRRVYQTALATDSFYVEECHDPESVLRYNEWVVDGKVTPYGESHSSIAYNWLHDPLLSYCKHVSSSVKGCVAALYEYYVSAHRAMPSDRIAYGGIPIDVEAVRFDEPRRDDGKLRLFLGYPSARMVEKGSERLLAAARQVERDYPDLCELQVVSDVKLTDFIALMRQSDVILDQVYSYTPATTALMAMAMGKTVLTGAEDDYYDFIGESTLRPAINVRPDDREIYQAIEHIVLNRHEIVSRGHEGRLFVEKHNSSRVVAERFLDFWTR